MFIIQKGSLCWRMLSLRRLAAKRVENICFRHFYIVSSIRLLVKDFPSMTTILSFRFTFFISIQVIEDKPSLNMMVLGENKTRDPK